MAILQTLLQSIMAATGVYTTWSGYLEWNHVTDLKIRINIKSVYIVRFSANGFIDLNSPLSNVCGTLLLFLIQYSRPINVWMTTAILSTPSP